MGVRVVCDFVVLCLFVCFWLFCCGGVCVLTLLIVNIVTRCCFMFVVCFSVACMICYCGCVWSLFLLD